MMEVLGKWRREVRRPVDAGISMDTGISAMKAAPMTKLLAMLLVLLLTAIGIVGCAGSDAVLSEEYTVNEEKKLIVYTSHKEEVYGPIIKEFEERTGIWVEVRDGGTTELLEAIRSEAGQGTCDVMFGGGVESYEAYQGFFEPYVCGMNERLDDQYQSLDGRWTPFTELPIVFIYNSKLVEEDEAPRSWEEFLTDRWKGKIAYADPRKSGSSYTVLATMAQILDMEVQPMLEAFATALDGKISAGSGEVADEVSAGIHLVGITLEETARKRIALGADIAMVYPSEGTSAVPDGCALIEGAPHGENARLFIDFTVSDDVQRLAEDQFCRRSVRLDLRQANAENSMKIVDYDVEWASRRQDEILGLWAGLVD